MNDTQRTRWLVLVTAATVACGGADDDVSSTDPVDVCLVPDCMCEFVEDLDAVGPVPPEELGHWAASHLELPGLPFEVDHVSVALASSAAGMTFTPCAGPQTTVQLFVSDSSTPPATPEVLWEKTFVPQWADGVAFNQNVLAVEPPLVVESEHLFVSIQMTGETDAFICLHGCKNATTERSDASWWSNGQDPPFAWATLTDFALEVGYNVGVDGHVVH